MLGKKFRKNTNVVTRQVAGETILVPITGNIANMEHIFSLNPVAEHIWTHLNGESSLEDIIGKIVLEFEVDTTDAEQDCLEFMDKLIEQQLVDEVK